MTKEERIAKYKIERRNPKGPIKRLYSIPEAAFYLGRTVDAVREMIYQGKIPYVKDNKRILLDIRDMDAWIDRNKQQFTF